MRPHPFVYLASQSPRRRQLLEQIGVAHELLLPDDVQEAEALEAVQPGEAAQDYVQRVTRLKLAAALDRLNRRGWPLAPVLCADTTVVLGRRILGKPQDVAEAMAMLQALSGRTHRVMTAVAVGVPTQDARTHRASQRATHRAPQRPPRPVEALSLSRVRFSPIPVESLRAYVQSGEPMGKAGAYGIQGAAAQWISHIEGSHSGIMGLPLHETAQLLRRVGAWD